MTRLFRRLRRGIKRASGALVGAFAIGVLKTVRAVDPDKMADFAGWMMSRIGPLLTGKPNRPSQSCCCVS